jgi:hypothetical protein
MMNATDYAYWCGRFKALVEAMAGEFPTTDAILRAAARETLRAFRNATTDDLGSSPSSGLGSSAGVSE